MFLVKVIVVRSAVFDGRQAGALEPKIILATCVRIKKKFITNNF